MMMASDVLWWVRAFTDCWYAALLLLVVMGSMLFDAGRKMDRPKSNARAVIGSAISLVMLAAYPFWLRPLMSAAIGGAP